MVHQELASCPDLSVAENLCLGSYPARAGVWLDRQAMRARARMLLRGIADDLDPTLPMGSLSVARRQLVQIAFAVGSGARILIFDEPTSSLSDAESERLFTLIDELRRRGTTMIYVSHRLAEVLRLSDRITVLRDGKMIRTLQQSEADTDTLIRLMIGRELDAFFPTHLNSRPGAEILKVEHLTSDGRFKDISFHIRAGEIVGMAGLVGSGRSEVARALFGLDPRVTGVIVFHGHDIRHVTTRGRIQRGMALVPEDRKRQGLAVQLSNRLNFSLPLLDLFSRWGFLRLHAELQEFHELARRLAVRPASPDAPAGSLSGGNQQKIVLAKWLARRSSLLILDEPTRGVDVGAKAAIHALVDELARQGTGILLISSELPEILHLSTRILIMRGGRLAGELTRETADQENLLRMMSGVSASRFPDTGS
jgi:ABC-type sugar transport system ATPase subunit